MRRSIRRWSGMALFALPALGLSSPGVAAGPYGDTSGRVSVFAPVPPTAGTARVGQASPLDLPPAPSAEGGVALPPPAAGPVEDLGAPPEPSLPHEEPHHAEATHHGAEHGHTHHAHAHHAHHEEEHEEESGHLTIWPYARFHASSLWDDTFDPMIGFNAGTIFWREPECWFGRPTRCGLILEFGYGAMDAKEDVTLVQPERRPAPAEFDIVGEPDRIGPDYYKVENAKLYTGNIGVAFETMQALGDTGMAMETGFAPVLLIGSLNSDFNRVGGVVPGDQAIFINQERERDSGTYVGGDFRVWMNVVSESGMRAGVFAFGGIADCEAVFSNSEDFNSYGGGLYFDMPTNWIPAKLPKLSGSTQWIDWLLEEI